MGAPAISSIRADKRSFAFEKPDTGRSPVCAVVNVRHQMIWDYFRFDLEEDWPHLIVDDYAAAFR
jgi:hypothetical protein